jgi:hypothetical protein
MHTNHRARNHHREELHLLKHTLTAARETATDRKDKNSPFSMHTNRCARNCNGRTHTNRCCARNRKGGTPASQHTLTAALERPGSAEEHTLTAARATATEEHTLTIAQTPGKNSKFPTHTNRCPRNRQGSLKNSSFSQHALTIARATAREELRLLNTH